MNSFLSKAGIAARRKCDLLIKQGLVSVDGTVIQEPGYPVDPDENTVSYRNKEIKSGKSRVYVLLNKPKGYICTLRDERKRPTVADLVHSDRRLFPVGRLDLSTSGLLMMTDDGELSNRLTHPKYEVDKVYFVELHKPLKTEHMERIRKGVDIGDSVPVRAQLKLVGTQGKKAEITVHEGRNRMVRRMFDVLGYRIKTLDRIGYAGLTKKKLPLGCWRYLSKKEVLMLYKITRLHSGQ
ncbi:pseudouridine synthase [candidate division KSB1 bacterium]